MNLRKLYTIVFVLIISIILSSCANRNSIIIYTALEDYRIDFVEQKLNEEFSDIPVKFQYYSTGTLASKLLFEENKTPCDIVLALEGTYLDKSSHLFYEYPYKYDNLTIDIRPEENNYIPISRESTYILYNSEKYNFGSFVSLNELLNEKYYNDIIMPNPKSSGTAYSLLNMVNDTYGIEYFEKLDRNIKMYTESGSATVKSVIKGEANIAFASIAGSKEYLNDKYKLTQIKEGTPYSVYGSALIKGHENKKGVKEVYDYIINEIIPLDNEMYSLEQIYKDKINDIHFIEGDINHYNVKHLYDYEYKNSLLDKWRY